MDELETIFSWGIRRFTRIHYKPPALDLKSHSTICMLFVCRCNCSSCIVWQSKFWGSCTSINSCKLSGFTSFGGGLCLCWDGGSFKSLHFWFNVFIVLLLLVYGLCIPHYFSDPWLQCALADDGKPCASQMLFLDTCPSEWFGVVATGEHWFWNRANWSWQGWKSCLSEGRMAFPWRGFWGINCGLSESLRTYAL